jgi:thioredoxin reductase (NADPH)
MDTDPGIDNYLNQALDLIGYGGKMIMRINSIIAIPTELKPRYLQRERWPLARPPYLLETSLPGVFAVGDVRSGSIKRVASAVGEGSIAISFIHKVLQE